jgi:predicted HicB family RNase H-like nuclease
VSKRDKFNNTIRFRCPPWLTQAIVAAADRSSQSVSDFLRQTVINELNIKPNETVATNDPHESI